LAIITNLEVQREMGAQLARRMRRPRLERLCHLSGNPRQTHRSPLLLAITILGGPRTTPCMMEMVAELVALVAVRGQPDPLRVAVYRGRLGTGPPSARSTLRQRAAAAGAAAVAA
jgi:hypothetical protein